MWLLEQYYCRKTGDIPYFARYSLLKIIWIPIRKTLNVVVIPNIPFNSWRVVLYRLLGYRIGRRVFIGMKCYLDDTEPRNFKIGDGAIISYGCYFSLHGKGQHRSNITIGDGAYIGMHSTIVAGEGGLDLGRDSVVGAGSVVIRSVAQGQRVAGNPARELSRVNGDVETASN